MRAYVECSPNQSKKVYLIDQSSNGRKFEDSGKVLAIYVSEIYQSIVVQLYQPTLMRQLSLVYMYNRQRFCIIRDLLSISVHRLGEFVARFCQPSRNVFENRITSFQ